MADRYGMDWAQEEYDRQEPPGGNVVATCAYCGREIYEGEKIYRLDGDMFCTDCISEEEAFREGTTDEY